MNDRLGHVVSSAGDIDGDGRSDVLVAAEDYVRLHRGTDDRVGGDACTITLPTGLFGLTAAAAGDVDGDGHDDFMLGSYSWDNHGAAFVYRGTGMN